MIPEHVYKNAEERWRAAMQLKSTRIDEALDIINGLQMHILVYRQFLISMGLEKVFVQWAKVNINESIGDDDGPEVSEG